MWKGVIIEESLEDASILDKITEVGYEESFLEEEEQKGMMHFHQFEIADEKKSWFVEEAKKILKEGWYTHIVKDGALVVIFRGKSFECTDKQTLEATRDYGLSVGVIAEQMPFEQLLKDPFY